MKIYKEYQVNEEVQCGGAVAASGSRWVAHQVVFDDDVATVGLCVFSDDTHTGLCKQIETTPADLATTDVSKTATTTAKNVLEAFFNAKGWSFTEIS